MKAFLNMTKVVLSMGILTATTLFFMSCGGDTPPSATEVATKKLALHNWKISNVQVDGTDQTALFTNMILSFGATTYTTTKGEPVWPSSGTWAFTDNTAETIKRNDDLEITIVEVTETSLKLSLDWVTGTLGPGRTASVSGDHVFTFVKQ
jgi:hypothetical protein